MASKTDQVLKAIAAEINSMVLPAVMPATNPLAKEAYAPQLERESENALRVLVASAGRSVRVDVARDRCADRWSVDALIIITRTLDETPADKTQPANYQTIDECVQNAEYIAEQLSSNKQIGGFSLTDIEHNELVSNDWLRQSSMFVSEISVRYI